MIWYYPIRIGIFAPQREQAKTDFDRLKQALQKLTQVIGEFDPDVSNANTLRLPNGSECYIFPVTSTSHPESKTLDLIIAEEAQSLNDHEFMNDIRPMGASTNAPIILIGSAGYRICYFYRLLQKRFALVFDYLEVIKQKREMYEVTGDTYHLNYETFVMNERERLGEDVDEFQVPYALKWKLGGGQFITMEHFDMLVGSHSRIYQDKQSLCYAGIDTAKNPDATVVTVIRKLAEPIKIKYRRLKESGEEEIVETEIRKEVINWLRLRGDNYKDQFDIIKAFLSHYNIQAVAIDSTGQGDFMPDMFEKETNWMDEFSGLYRVKFSALSKDVMYKNLSVSTGNLLTRFPKIETKEAEEFKQQLLDLQKEYKGELLSCHHPNSPDAHDDYPDSLALAELAYMRHQQDGQLDIRFI